MSQSCGTSQSCGLMFLPLGRIAHILGLKKMAKVLHVLCFLMFLVSYIVHFAFCSFLFCSSATLFPESIKCVLFCVIEAESEFIPLWEVFCLNKSYVVKHDITRSHISLNMVFIKYDMQYNYLDAILHRRELFSPCFTA